MRGTITTRMEDLQMTAKRFKKERGTFWDKDKRLNMDETVELLNELYEENEHLKQSFKEVLKDLEVTTFDKELLEKENERLKKELDQFYLLIGRGDWSGLVDLINGDY